ncbi:mCG1034286, isoform CRA_b, partial [Mus musculus]
GIYVSGYRKYGNSETRRKPAPCLEGIRHLRSRPCQGPPEKTNALVLSYLWGTNLVPPGDPRSHQEIRGNPSLQKSAVSWLRGGIIPKGLPVEVVALSPRRLLLHLLDSSRTLLLRRSSEIDFFPSRNQVRFFRSHLGHPGSLKLNYAFPQLFPVFLFFPQIQREKKQVQALKSLSFFKKKVCLDEIGI